MPTHDVDLGGHLLHAARPVLEDLDEQLRDTPFCTVLADRDGHVVRRWSASRTVDTILDELHIGLGLSLHEGDVGTNALGTPLETGEGLSVDGDEHFLEVLRRFSCYGHPIRHPLTRRVEGVLDVTTLTQFSSPLLPPLIARVVADIEQRLLDGSRASEKRLLDAFQAASALHRRPVVAIGEDLVLSNQAALDLLAPSDVGRLRALVSDGPHGGLLALDLESGRQVTVEVTPVRGAGAGAVLQVRPVAEKAPELSVRPSQGRPLAPVLVSGPAGSGRTTRAVELAVRHPVTVLDASVALTDGEEAWAAAFGRALGRRTSAVVVDGSLVRCETVVVDDIDLLSDRLLELVARRVDDVDRPQLVLTSGPAERLSGWAATLAGTATRRHVTLPLSARRSELPAIAARMLGEIEPVEHLQLMPSAVAALVAHAWPGNLRELRAVLTHATQRRWGTSIAVKDLPDGYRSEVQERPLALLDQAQRDVIVGSLQRHDGNKVAAARELGLSRTTLYARMRALRITAY